MGKIWMAEIEMAEIETRNKVTKLKFLDKKYQRGAIYRCLLNKMGGHKLEIFR